MCADAAGKPIKQCLVVAVVCNTDYAYSSESSRTNKFDYRLLISGVDCSRSDGGGEHCFEVVAVIDFTPGFLPSSQGMYSIVISKDRPWFAPVAYWQI